MIQTLLFAPLLLPGLAVALLQDPPAPAVSDKVSWFSGTLEAAVAEGKSKGKIVMAFYRTDQDTGSTNLSRAAFSDDRVVAALANIVCVRVDAQSMTPLASRTPIKHLPVLVWFNPDGTPRDRLDGVYEAESFLAETARIVNDLGTINDLRRKLADRQEDVDAHFELFLRLRSAGDVDGMIEEKAIILRLDPEGTSRARMRFRYEEITNAIEKHWAEKRVLPMDKVAELRTFVELQDDPEILWDGWMRLANTHQFLERQSAGKPEEMKAHRATRRDCLSRAWRGVPQNPDFLRDWCLGCSELFWSQRDELSEADKAFLLAMTMRMVQKFEQDPESFAYRARALKLTGKLEDANAAARKAVELAPGNVKYQQVLQEIQGR